MSFPYPLEYNGDFTRIPSGCYGEIWKHTPSQVQLFFEQIFKEGRRFCLMELIELLKSYKAYIAMRKKDFSELNNIVYWVPED